MMEKKLSRRVVTCSVAIAATPARTFEALIHPHDLKRWWGVKEAVIAPQKGGTWTLGWHAFGQDNFYVTSASVERIAANQELRLRNVMGFRPDMKPFGPMRLTFLLKKRGEETIVTVRQIGHGTGKRWDWYFRAIEEGWQESLWNLKKYLERKARRRKARVSRQAKRK